MTSQQGYTSESEFGALSNEEESEPFEELRLHLQTLKRHVALIVVVALVGTVLAALRTWRLPAIYSSSASIRLTKEAPDPAQAKYAMYWDGMSAQYLNSEIRDMTSLTLAQEVIRSRPKVAAELADDAGTDDLTVLAGMFLSGVSISPDETTYVVDINYTSTKPERCAVFANALADAYTDQRLSLWGDKTRQAEESIAEVASNLSVTLATSQRKLRNFVERNQIPLFERQETILLAQVGANNTELSEIQRERIRLEAEREAMQRVRELGRDLESAPSVADSAVIGLLRSRLADTELQLASLRQRYGEAWPEVQSLRSQRDQVKLLLRQEIDLLVSQLDARLEARTSEEQGLQRRARQLREKSRELAAVSTEYKTLKDDVEANRAFLDSFDERRKDITAYSRVGVDKVRVVDQAVGARRIGPNHTKNVVTGAVMGLAFGVVFALLIDRLSDRITNFQQATRTLHIPVLAVVPEVSDATGRDMDRYSITNSRSIYAEAFRRGRVQLNATGAFPQRGCAVLMCASGVPQEGKTSCAVNLAIAAAHVGKRTLLIDGDIRGPRAHGVFQLPISPGLVDALGGMGPLQAIHDTDVENLYVMPSGQTALNAAQLLGRGGHFADLVNVLRGQFDRIVIDTPPIAAFSDGTLMAPSADAVVLVVSGRASRRSATLLAFTELSRVGREPVGILFNHQSQSDYGYFGYYYQQYGGRYTEPDARPPAMPVDEPVGEEAEG